MSIHLSVPADHRYEKLLLMVTPFCGCLYERPSTKVMEYTEMSVCTAAILKFPAKHNVVLKNKEMCHLEHKTPEQMLFKFLRYLI